MALTQQPEYLLSYTTRHRKLHLQLHAAQARMHRLGWTRDLSWLPQQGAKRMSLYELEQHVLEVKHWHSVHGLAVAQTAAGIQPVQPSTSSATPRHITQDSESIQVLDDALKAAYHAGLTRPLQTLDRGSCCCKQQSPQDCR